MDKLETIKDALDRLWKAHSVVVSSGSWERHVEPEIYHIYKNIMPLVDELINDKEEAPTS